MKQPCCLLALSFAGLLAAGCATTGYQNLEFHFQNLRTTFNALEELAQQLQSPRAANAAAELQAGLNIISEAFVPVQQEMQAGTLNRDTVLRMCQVMKRRCWSGRRNLRIAVLGWE